MLIADAVDVTIDLGRLLRGEYYLPDVTLTHPKLALEIGPDGRHNWYLDPSKKTASRRCRWGGCKWTREMSCFTSRAKRPKSMPKYRP